MKIHTLKIVAISLVLLSSQALFAHAKNRLEVRADRLEMPLQRQEMEDRRWEMEVDAQGCSFQEIEGSVINGIEYKDVDNQSSLLANNSVPISHLPSSISYLGITPKLIMNPSTIENGTKSLGEAFGVLGKRVGTVTEGEEASRNDVAQAFSSSNSSNQVLRLRGGGPKKPQPTEGSKATRDSSDEDGEDDNASDADSSEEEDIHDVLNAHIEDAIETEGRAHVASNLLEKSLQAKKEFKKQRALASGRADMETRSVSSVDSTWIQNTLYKTRSEERRVGKEW